MKIILSLILATLTSCAIEKPSYTSIRKDGNLEIRKYATIPIVSAPMDDMGKRDDSFRSLFRYISGGNESEQKMAMTSPVFMKESEKKDQAGKMSFMIPAEISKKGAPKPNAESLKVSEIGGGIFVVYEFSGWNDAEKRKQASTSLSTWINKESLKTIGSPFFAFYNPPWTPEMLRRNEVWQRIQE